MPLICSGEEHTAVQTVISNCLKTCICIFMDIQHMYVLQTFPLLAGETGDYFIDFFKCYTFRYALLFKKKE